MNKFIERPASNISKGQRGLVHGVGINDAEYIVRPLINGKKVLCPIYRKWAGMIERCYSDKHKIRFPTYKGCSVSEEWLTFSNFKAWMESQDWQGKQLDKDILVAGNKIYSKDKCIFVSGAINSLLISHESSRGNLPQGVTHHAQTGKYRAMCNVHGRNTHVGLFETSAEAASKYLRFKSELIHKTAYEPEAIRNQELKSALLRHAKSLIGRAVDIEKRLNNELQ